MEIPSKGHRGSAACSMIRASAALPAALLFFCASLDLSGVRVREQQPSSRHDRQQIRSTSRQGSVDDIDPGARAGVLSRPVPSVGPSKAVLLGRKEAAWSDKLPGTSRQQTEEVKAFRDNSIVVMTTTSDSVENIIRWANYHRSIGVDQFYIFANGPAATEEASRRLGSEPGVKLFRPQDDPWLIAQQQNSSVWRAAWLRTYLHKPCNFELFVTQSLNMESALATAVRDNITWVAHLDLDELLYPSGSTDFSLIRMLAEVPPDVDNLVVPNYEAVPEHTHVVDPFSEVTLFKKNFHHTEREQYKKYKHVVARENPDFFLVYGNGKSIARVRPNIRPNGAHRFAYIGQNTTERRHPSMAVLHFPYTRFADLRGRRDRCDCLPTKEDASRCFMLEFDRQAFIQSSLLDDQQLLEWYRQRVVFENRTLVNELCHAGILERIYLPRAMITDVSTV